MNIRTIQPIGNRTSGTGGLFPSLALTTTRHPEIRPAIPAKGLGITIMRSAGYSSVRHISISRRVRFLAHGLENKRFPKNSPSGDAARFILVKR